MNRKQRRALSKQNLTHKDLKVIQEIESKNAIAYTVHQYSAAVALCLHDKLGFGKVRAQRFMQDVEELFDSINQDYLSLDDVLETVKNELGIEIK
jgi:hypothetical protein